MKKPAGRRGIYISLLGRQPQPARVQNKVHFAGKTIPNFLGNLKMLAEEVHHWRLAGNAVIILVSSYQREQLLSALQDEKVDAFMPEPRKATSGRKRGYHHGQPEAVLSCPAAGWW